MITRKDLEYLVEEFENYGNPEVVLETPDHIKSVPLRPGIMTIKLKRSFLLLSKGDYYEAG